MDRTEDEVAWRDLGGRLRLWVRVLGYHEVIFKSRYEDWFIDVHLYDISYHLFLPYVFHFPIFYRSAAAMYRPGQHVLEEAINTDSRSNIWNVRK